jgi:F-type H+-transporting ATPase subunit b
MPPAERARMAADLGVNSPLQVASAQALSAPQTQNCRARIGSVLGREVPIDFTLDPELIAGVELRFPHSVLTCSWKESLTQALDALLKSDGNAARPA